MFRQSALLSMALWVVFVAVVRVAVVPPESCGAANIAAVERAGVSAAEWMQRNQRSDGSYLYVYNADTDVVSPDYNEVHHAGVTMALYQAAGRYRDAEALRVADAGLAWMNERLVRRDGWAALVAPSNRAKLGASALMLVALSERRLATVDGRYDPLMRELGRFIVALEREDGGFYVAWSVSEGALEREGTSRSSAAKRSGRWRSCTRRSSMRAGMAPPAAPPTSLRRVGTR